MKKKIDYSWIWNEVEMANFGPSSPAGSSQQTTHTRCCCVRSFQLVRRFKAVFVPVLAQIFRATRVIGHSWWFLIGFERVAANWSIVSIEGEIEDSLSINSKSKVPSSTSSSRRWVSSRKTTRDGGWKNNSLESKQ